jgi:uncharacterized RDD family membrane protein YckC
MNPYEPPAAPVLDVEQTVSRQPDASKGKRFLNFIIDRFVAVFVIAFSVGALWPAGGEWLASLNRIEDILVSTAMLGAYYIVCEGTSGYTLGKLLTGTRVFNEHGKRPSFWQIIGRSACRCIPFEPFSFLGSGAGGWHDSMSGTRVLDMRAQPKPAHRPPPPRGTLPVQRPRPLPAQQVPRPLPVRGPLPPAIPAPPPPPETP